MRQDWYGENLQWQDIRIRNSKILENIRDISALSMRKLKCCMFKWLILGLRSSDRVRTKNHIHWPPVKSIIISPTVSSCNLQIKEKNKQKEYQVKARYRLSRAHWARTDKNLGRFAAAWALQTIRHVRENIGAILVHLFNKSLINLHYVPGTEIKSGRSSREE